VLSFIVGGQLDHLGLGQDLVMDQAALLVGTPLSSDIMATTMENSSVQENVASVQTAYENVESATGTDGLTSDTRRNITTDEEYTKFTDSSLLVADNTALVGTQINDVEEVASVVSFLQRPCLVYYATLNANSITPISSFGSLTGPAPQPFIKAFKVPHDTLKFGKRVEKLTNFEWFKADTVFRIMTNVNPYVAGKLWACYSPYDDDLLPQTQILQKGRAAITSYPGVEIDLQSCNAAVIRVPWSSTLDAMSLTRGVAPIGKFYLFALTPIMCVGNPKIPIEVFSHFENIEIHGPTPLGVTLQGREAKGPIEEISGKVGAFASGVKDILAPIPIVGTIASAVPWVADIVGGVASIFGWSRPVVGSGAPPLCNIPGRGFAQNKCEDSSVMLAFNNDNRIGENEVNFLQDLDEMATEHICGRPALVDSVKWLVDSVPLAEVSKLQVGPFVSDKRITNWTIGTQQYQAFDLSLFENIAGLFGLWKADMHFRVNIVRTPFHVGRLEVFFVPRVSVSDALFIDQMDTTNLYRHIIDITETNELEFVVPYMHERTMCSTGVTPQVDRIYTQSPGVLVVRALSPLNCPETVSQYVTVNVWAWATNVALACPIGHGLRAYPTNSVDVRLQGVVRNEEMGIETVVFGKTNNAQNVLDTTQIVGGEVALNMRAMTRCHRSFISAIGNQYLINCNMIGGFDGYIGKMSNIFAFHRGGLSFKLRPTFGQTINSNSYIRTTLVRTESGKPVFGDNVEHITYPYLNPIHEIQVPYYNSGRRGLNNNKLSSTSPDSATRITPCVYVETNIEDLTLIVGAKDDLTYGYLIGPPIYTKSKPVVPKRMHEHPEMSKPFKFLEQVDAMLQGVEQDFHEEPTPQRGVITAYYGTTKIGRKFILKNGFSSKSGNFKLFKDKNRITRPIKYEIRIQEDDIIFEDDEIIVVDKIEQLMSVTIYNNVTTLFTQVKLQGLSDYNPLNVIRNLNETLDASKNFFGKADNMLGAATECLERMKVTLFGQEVQGLLLKLTKIIANAFMAERKLILYNLILNTFLEFGSTVYNSLLCAMNIDTVLQSGITDIVSITAFKKYVSDNGQVSALVVTSVISMIFLTLFGIPSGNLDSIIKIVGQRARSLKNIYDFSQVGNKMFESIGDTLMYYVFGCTKTPELDQYVSGYKEWTDEVMGLGDVTNNLSVRLEKDDKLVLKIDKLYRQGVAYASVIGNIKGRQEVILHYNRVFKIIEEARKLCDYTGVFGNKPRVKPLVVQLFGESGVGKSGMSWPLACDLNMLFSDNVATAKNFAQEIYSRNTEQEFWDGYAGQNIVVYDDFGQRVDSGSSPNEEFIELIRAANVAPYALHMAELSEKKRTKFISKVILLSQNVINLNVTSLTFPDAYRRRIDICGKVILKKEYVKKGYSATTGEMVERLDPLKCASAVDTAPYLIEMYNAESMQPMYNEEGPVVLDYEQFLKECIRMTKYNISQSVNFNKILEERVDESRFNLINACMQSNYIPTTFYEIKDQIIDGVREVYNEYASLKNSIILVGVILSGLGLWAYFKPEKKTSPKRLTDKFSLEANSSGDSRTNKSKTVAREANGSGDSRTNKAKIVKRESDKIETINIKNRFVDSDDGCSLEAAVSGDMRTKHSKSIVRESVEVDMQAWKDASAQDLINTRVLNNLYMISVKRGDSFNKILQCLFIRDTVALVPKHLFMSITDEDTIKIRNIFGSEFILPMKCIKAKNIVSVNGYDKDAALLQFPRYVNAHSDLVKHFQTMPELSVRRADVCVPTIRNYGGVNTLTVLGNSSARMFGAQFNTEHGTMTVRDCLEYTLNTINGDCGSPVVCQETTFIRKIAGIHIAGSTDGTKAYGQSITQQDLLTTLEQFSKVVTTDFDSLPNIETKSVKLQQNVEYNEESLIKLLGVGIDTFGNLGDCTSKIFVPSKSDIRKSIFYDKIDPVLTAPSVLYSPDEDIMIKNMKKNAINTPYISDSEVDAAVSEVERLLLSNRDPELARVLTYEEAIRGCDHSPYLSSLNRHSSAGYPWVLQRKAGKPGKTGWFGDDEVFLYDETVRKAVEARISDASKGIRTPTVWSATLKDERRPLEKVLARKTRVFASGPQDYTIAFRQYFLGFIAHIMENRIDNEQSVGTNVYDYDWTRTAKKLMTKGDKVFAGDFSSFDGTLNSNIMSKFVSVVNKFYNDGPENALIREVLFLDVYNSIQLCNNRFVSLSHSQPSGNPCTTILNSFYNSVSMRIAYYRCMGSHEKPFDDHVSMVSYGDDNVINLSDSVADKFNQITVTNAYASFGMIYTDETKSDQQQPFRQLSEVAYLKRKFRKDGPVYRAPMPMEVIMETPNWVRKCTDEQGAALDNIRDSVYELAQYSVEHFKEHSSRLIDIAYSVTNQYPEVYPYERYISDWDQNMGFGVQSN